MCVKYRCAHFYLFMFIYPLSIIYVYVCLSACLYFIYVSMSTPLGPQVRPSKSNRSLTAQRFILLSPSHTHTCLLQPPTPGPSYADLSDDTGTHFPAQNHLPTLPTAFYSPDALPGDISCWPPSSKPPEPTYRTSVRK